MLRKRAPLLLLFIVLPLAGIFGLGSCTKKCNCEDLDLPPDTWKLADSLIHPNIFLDHDSGRWVQFLTADSLRPTALIDIEFNTAPVKPGTYRIVRSPRLPNDVSVRAHFDGDIFAPADSASMMELSFSGGKKTFIARGIKLNSINHIWVNSTAFLSLNLTEM